MNTFTILALVIVVLQSLAIVFLFRNLRANNDHLHTLSEKLFTHQRAFDDAMKEVEDRVADLEGNLEDLERDAVTEEQLDDRFDDVDVDNLERRIEQIERDMPDDAIDFDELSERLEDIEKVQEGHASRLTTIETAGDSLCDRVVALERK